MGLSYEEMTSLTEEQLEMQVWGKMGKYIYNDVLWPLRRQQNFQHLNHGLTPI